MKATHLKGFQFTNVMLGHRPCLLSIEEHRQHQGSKDAYFGGNAMAMLWQCPAVKYFLSPNLIHFARFL